MAFSILGCPHTHLSFPMVTEATPKAKPPASAPRPQPHVTCLDCGREFWYDWQQMRRLAARPQTVYPSRRAA